MHGPVFRVRSLLRLRSSLSNIVSSIACLKQKRRPGWSKTLDSCQLSWLPHCSICIATRVDSCQRYYLGAHSTMSKQQRQRERLREGERQRTQKHESPSTSPNASPLQFFALRVATRLPSDTSGRHASVKIRRCVSTRQLIPAGRIPGLLLTNIF